MFKIISLYGIPYGVIDVIKIIALDYLLRMSVDKFDDNGREIHPCMNSRYPVVHRTCTDFADLMTLNSLVVPHSML